MSNKKVLAVLGNANSVHTLRWLNPFKKSAQIHLISLQKVKDMNDSINYHYLKGHIYPKIGYFFNIKKLRNLIKDISPDILHVHYATGYGLLGASSKAKCPKLLTVWGSDITYTPKKNPFARWIVKKSLGHYDWINAPAEHIRRKLVALGADEKKISVFPCGVELDKFQFKKILPKKGIFKIISVRNHDSLYRVENIISGFEKYSSSLGNNMELVLVGKILPKVKARILKMAKNISDKIKTLGYVSEERLIAEMRGCDICISISKRDGTPQSLLECLATGLFPIVSNIDANQEWVFSEEAIFLNRFDPDTIADSLKMAVDRIKNGFSGKSNRAIVEERGNYVKNMSGLKDTYHNFGLL